MRKRVVLALLLVVAMVVTSGCSLVVKDAEVFVGGALNPQHHSFTRFMSVFKDIRSVFGTDTINNLGSSD